MQSQPADQHLREQVELLRRHDADLSTNSPSFDNGRPSSRQSPSQASSGYDGTPRHPSAPLGGETESHIHPDLRNQSPEDTMMPIAPPSGHSPGHSPAPQPAAPLAPAPAMMNHQSEDISPENRKAKRELSQSKRAAQNRAAQRAFRQRKECHIKKLESQVRDFVIMEQNFRDLQAENYALREYIASLQGRLADASGEVPPPPSNINLSQPPPGSVQMSSANAPTAAEPSSTATGTPLEAVAQAVAGLAAHEQMEQRQQQQQQQQQQQRYPSPTPKAESNAEDARSAEDIHRQMQAEPTAA